MNKKISFLIGCIGSRLLLVIFSKYIKYSKILNIITFLIGLSFLILYTFDLRKTGFEATNNIIWWNDIRPIHGTLYILFSIYYLKKKKYAWIILLIDVIFGLIIYLFKMNLFISK